MKEYIQTEISVSEQPEKDRLIAQLADFGFEGFEEERSSLKAFIPLDQFRKEEFETMMREGGLRFSIQLIEEQNWNALWEAGFEPVVVDNFCAVRADFHQRVPGIKYDIIITPKMSFGTGHHATTYMMIEQMQQIDFDKKQVFDFGTGTGVLAILAEKSGASFVEAIDNDDWSIDNAMENLLRNQSEKISLKKRDLIEGEGRYDIVLANVNKHVIINQLKRMTDAVVDKGIILLSGLLAEDESDIHVLATGAGLSLRNKLEKHNWICLMYVR